MCGIGTTMLEAVHLGRDAVGVEYEPRWADLARANLAYAKAHGARGDGRVHTGDGRDLPRHLPAELHGRVALVLTSPPYGASVHGHVTATPTRGVAKTNDRHTSSARGSGSLAHASDDGLLDAFTGILAATRSVLRPGGIVVVTARPWRRNGVLVDFPAAVTTAAEHAGLILLERNVALLAGLRGDRLVSRASFFQLHRVRAARARGVPLRVIAHEDVLVLRGRASISSADDGSSVPVNNARSSAGPMTRKAKCSEAKRGSSMPSRSLSARRRIASARVSSTRPAARS
jgi:hypothetical protein